MRLTCPNCEAQYEVPDDVIPSDGRDVQCSNCGDTWYQTHPSSDQAVVAEQISEPESEPELTTEEDPVSQPQETPPAQEPEVEESEPATAPSEPEPEPEPQPEPEPEPEPEPTYEEESPDASPQATGLARGMDPSVTGILREEAEREAQLRAAESVGAGTETDQGRDMSAGDEASRHARQARDRMARLKGENPALLAAAESGSRRGLLPDIEEINSTLRAGSDPVAAPASVAAEQDLVRRKSGFSRGFAVALLLVLALVMIYANAPQIAETLPQADPYLSAFVAWVDQARLWLDATVKGLVSAQ